MSKEMLIEYCQRLGVSDRDTIEKSKEYLRLIGMKKCVKNETVKVILSIDCAATTCNSEIDIDDAIKFSGMKRKEYIGQKELVEKLCDLGKKLTLDEICAQLELNDLIKMDAAHLLQQYAKTKLLSDEITNAQYLAMAIYQSCQKRKYKTSNIKSKLIQISRLSTKMWKYMEQEWTNWIEENPSLHKNLKTSNEQTEEKGCILQKDQPNGNKNIIQIEPEIQPYEEWRESMIKRAKAKLRKIQG